jgi:hypothetical protein
MLILTEVGTSSMMIENVNQRLASANHEKTRLKRLYLMSAYSMPDKLTKA